MTWLFKTGQDCTLFYNLHHSSLWQEMLTVVKKWMEDTTVNLHAAFQIVGYSLYYKVSKD